MVEDVEEEVDDVEEVVQERDGGGGINIIIPKDFYKFFWGEP